MKRMYFYNQQFSLNNWIGQNLIKVPKLQTFHANYFPAL